jgi:H-NS histone family protein
MEYADLGLCEALSKGGSIKYRNREGNTWAGRGAQPVWLREKLKAGAKLEDFAVESKAAARKAPRGVGDDTRRKAKGRTRNDRRCRLAV